MTEASLLSSVYVKAVCWILFTAFLSGVLGLIVGLVFLVHARLRTSRMRRELREKSPNASKIVLGFFHPYCSGGGGGERVLWKMVEDIGYLSERGFSVQIVIYTIDPPKQNYAKGTKQPRCMHACLFNVCA